MSYLPKTILMAALAMPLVGGTGESVARGCGETVNGLFVPLFTGSLMVDGTLLGELGPVEPDGSLSLLGGFELDDEDILHMWLGCLEIEQDGETVGVRVVAIVTKGGAVTFMRSYLNDLVEDQEEYRTATGVYAQHVRELPIFASQPRLPIEMVVNGNQWTAELRLERDETSCVGSAVMHGEGSISPEVAVRCR